MVDDFDSAIIDSLPPAIIVLQRLQDGFQILRKNSNFNLINDKYLGLPNGSVNEGDIVRFSSILEKNPNTISKALINIALDVLNQAPGFFKRTTVMFRTGLDDQETNNIIGKRGIIPFHILIFKIQTDVIGIILQDILRDSSNGTEKSSIMNKLKMQSVFNFLPAGIFIVEDNRIRFANRNFVNTMGYDDPEELSGRRIEEFVHPDDLQDFLLYLETILAETDGSAQEREIRFIRKKGQAIWFSLSNSLYHDTLRNKKSAIFSCVDITERKKTELTLLQTHRLASIGDLTAGVAHEINNPLFGIMNYSALLIDTLESAHNIKPNSEEHEFIEGIAEEARRISNIINNLAEFTRKSEEREFKPTHLAKIIQKVEKLLAYQIRHTFITVEKDIPEDLPLINLQKFRIEQAIFNIMLNSIHALEETDKKDRKIKICVQIEESKPRDLLKIEIFDNGIGIKDENMVKVFNPFFTTKRGIKGSGLGLHQAYNIVTDHHGKINVDSEYGKWTCVNIEIPAEIASGAMR